jgi:hypothetical protein
MKPSFSRFESSFKCAIIFGGIYAFVITLVGFWGPALRLFFHTAKGTNAGIKDAFFLIAILGFILGYFLPAQFWKRCPEIVVSFSAVFLVIGCMLFLVGTHKSIPFETKLADCTNGIVNIHLHVPKGHRYALELDAPGTTRMTNGSLISSYKFTGTIRIKSGTSLIADVPMNSDKMMVFPSSYFLTGGPKTDIPDLNQFIHSGNNYDLEIKFDPPPPPSSSVSLYWMQNAAEKGE